MPVLPDDKIYIYFVQFFLIDFAFAPPKVKLSTG